MSEGRTHWLAGRPAGMSAAEVPAFLELGRWESPNPAGHRGKLLEMSPGDGIALKSTRTATSGLPFFNADEPVSVMTIHAVGAVESVDAESGLVAVRWEPYSEPRDWYFFTYVAALSRIDSSHRSSGPVSRFIFEGEKQDMDFYLRDDPYWTTRYPKPPGFTWIPWFEEFADRLADFQDDRSPLVEIIIEFAADEPLLHAFLGDEVEEGVKTPIRDIDPFTVFTVFCRGISDENRNNLLTRFADRLGVSAPVPNDVDGVPLANNQNAWFVSYEKDREPDDVDALWRVFAAAVSLSEDDSAENRREFEAAYDRALAVRKVRWNLSSGLYWARPDDFMTLDGPSRQLLRERYGLDAPTDGAGYLELRDRIREQFSQEGTSITSFPLLSYAAWFRGKQTAPKHDMSGFAYWAARMAESVDLDEDEHDYKRETAALLRQARDLALAGDSQWQTTLHSALKSTNTLSWQFIDDVHKATLADPDGMLAALNVVWQQPTVSVLDAFQEALRTVLGSVTPGNATGLGAWLLMSVNLEENAPYSPTRSEKWYKLTGFKGPGSASSATSRYSRMLEFLDELQGALGRESGNEFSRLEVQGAAWATTEHAVPSDWSREDQEALRAWRSTAQVAQRAWLLRPTNLSTRDWVANNYISLPATNLGDVAAGSKEKLVKEAVDVGYQHEDYSQRQSLTAEYYAFLTLMKSGDLVTAQSDTTVHVGVIESEPDYAGEPNDRLHRCVDWQAEVPVADLAATVLGLLDLQGNVVDVTQGLEELRALLDVVPPPPNPADLRFPTISKDFAAGLNMDVAPIQEIVDLLGSRRQVVFYGPPGTGKTYLAMKLARYLVGPEDRSRVQLVQFHPSYAYEDFFEGFRPTETKQGEATFELAPGPLRRIAKDAKANPDKPYILVIDELNRANLAKVFGELYFLLEYRKESIQLQYNPTEAFQLPPNLFFIGTMNTADRSIALLDAAMRRRFSFVELHPDEPPVRDVLSRFLSAKGADTERARLLATLNAAIEEQDRDLRIGPSYLMREEAATEGGLNRIWKYDLMPLLEEHYYGRLTRQQIHDKFGLDAIRKTARGDYSGSFDEETTDDLDPDVEPPE